MEEDLSFFMYNFIFMFFQYRGDRTQVQRSRSVMDVQAEEHYSTRRSRSPHHPPHHSSSFDLGDSDYSLHDRQR